MDTSYSYSSSNVLVLGESVTKASHFVFVKRFHLRSLKHVSITHLPLASLLLSETQPASQPVKINAEGSLPAKVMHQAIFFTRDPGRILNLVEDDERRCFHFSTRQSSRLQNDGTSALFSPLESHK